MQGDAYAYVPDRPVDLRMSDIWLPLIGPELPDYAEKLNLAPRRWMRDHRLLGSGEVV